MCDALQETELYDGCETMYYALAGKSRIYLTCASSESISEEPMFIFLQAYDYKIFYEATCTIMNMLW